jgi:hypothetical protein
MPAQFRAGIRAFAVRQHGGEICLPSPALAMGSVCAAGCRAVKNGGYAIVSTFGPEGPTKCSGLGVVRYDAESLHRELGVKFRLLGSSKEFHQTPFGTTQQFLYCYYRLE